VSDTYNVVIHALSPADWLASGGRRVRIALSRRDQPEEVFPLEMVGSGVATWAMYAIDEAVRRVRRDVADGFLASTGGEGILYEDVFTRPALYLIDEPEQNLHPLALRDATQFLAAMAWEGSNVIVASHSPAFLDVPFAEAQYAQVRRVSGYTGLDVLGPQALSKLDDAGEAVGISRADLLQLTRGFLIVEGLHDELVVQHLFGDDLAAARVRVLALRGAHNAVALVDAQLLLGLGIPTCVMLDRTADAFVHDLNRGRIRPSDASTKEEKQLASLATELRTSRPRRSTSCLSRYPTSSAPFRPERSPASPAASKAGTPSWPSTKPSLHAATSRLSCSASSGCR
jgi:hypothetical protein